ncbi:hypothetical protein [Streptomyces atratus]
MAFIEVGHQAAQGAKVHSSKDPARGTASIVIRTDLRLYVRWDGLGSHAKGIEESADRHGGCDGRLSRRVEAAQVHIQLTVWEAVEVLVGPVQDQAGLADSADASE